MWAAMRLVIGSIVLALLVVDATDARAQGNPGSVRVGLQSSFYASDAVTVELDGEEDDFTRRRVGIGGLGLGASLGFAIGEYVVLGARVGYDSQTIDSGSSSSETTISSHLALGNVEAVLMPGSRTRPMFMGLLGLIGSTTTVGTSELTFSGFAFGFGGGVHLFATETFSITPSLSFIWSSGSADLRGEDEFGDSVSTELDQSQFTVMLAVELAGWIGGQPTQAPPPEWGAGGAPPAGPGQAPPGWMGTPPPPSAPRGSVQLPPLPPNPVTGEVPLSQATMDLVATWSAPDTVELRMRAWGMQARFRNCTSFTLRDGTSELPLEVVDNRIGALGRGVEEVVIARAPRAALERMLAAPAPAVTLCGTAWQLDAQARNMLDMFLRRLREQAQRYGTLNAPGQPTAPLPGPAAPAPPPPAPPPGGATPPPPQDPELGPTWGPPPGM